MYSLHSLYNNTEDIYISCSKLFCAFCGPSSFSNDSYLMIQRYHGYDYHTDKSHRPSTKFNRDIPWRITVDPYAIFVGSVRWPSTKNPLAVSINLPWTHTWIRHGNGSIMSFQKMSQWPWRVVMKQTSFGALRKKRGSSSHHSRKNWIFLHKPSTLPYPPYQETSISL